MWAFPSVLWSFPLTATFTSFPAPRCWACAATPAFSGQLAYLEFCEGLPLPPFGTQGAPPSLLCVFFVVFAYYSIFFSFFPGWGSVCPGGCADLAQCCLWKYHVPLSSPCVLHLPKWYGCCCLAAAREPSWFLCLMWNGNVMHGLGVWRSERFASSWWFFL
jgi:hypothetical protein